MSFCLCHISLHLGVTRPPVLAGRTMILEGFHSISQNVCKTLLWIALMGDEMVDMPLFYMPSVYCTALGTEYPMFPLEAFFWFFWSLWSAYRRLQEGCTCAHRSKTDYSNRRTVSPETHAWLAFFPCTATQTVFGIVHVGGKYQHCRTIAEGNFGQCFRRQHGKKILENKHNRQQRKCCGKLYHNCIFYGYRNPDLLRLSFRYYMEKNFAHWCSSASVFGSITVIVLLSLGSL